MQTADKLLAARTLTDVVRRLAQASLGGAAELERALQGQNPVPREPEDGRTAPVGPAWLRRISVAGFQGIGPAVELQFDPGPGLTLLVGRNGSGKSSLSEAAEIALTGTSSRWEGKGKIWKDGWRNLHADEPPRIEVEFLTEGSTDPVTVTLAPRGSTAAGTSEVRQGDAKRSFVSLGWKAGLDSYRPFLPYAELGALVGGKPTVAYDALTRGLDLSVPTAAVKALKEAAADRAKAWKAVLEERAALVRRLETHDDARVARCLGAMRRGNPDLEAIAEVLAGTDSSTGRDLEELRRLIAFRAPDADAVKRAGETLLQALAQNVDVARSDAGRDLAVADLLRQAIRFHQAHGEAVCPVCNEGRLDGEWLDRAESNERSLRSTAVAATSAEARLSSARRAFEQLIPVAVPALPDLSRYGIDLSGPMQGFEALVNVRRIEGDRERVEAAVDRARTVEIALSGLRSQAQRAVAAQEDVWRDLAPLVAAWLERARRAKADHEWVSPLKSAQGVMEGVLRDLRVERWRPIEGVVRGLWEKLRVTSNVSLEGLRPDGTGVQRRIDFRLSVDGVSDAAIGVMSQGELNALALSVFLPRVTLEESPFRFVILDDPIQSMDVARVDGLARVLEELSRTRQIVVLTHDSRLVEALVRLQIPATIHKVERAPNSRVTIKPAMTPAWRYLADARLLIGDGVPETFARQSVPVLARLAIEERCIQVIRGRIVSSGGLHFDADRLLDGLTRTMEKVAYLVFDEKHRTGDLYAEMNRRFGGWSVDALKACSEGAHGSFEGDTKKLIDDVGRLIRELK